MELGKFVIVSFQLNINNNHYHIIVLYILKQLVICISSMFVYLLHMQFCLLLDYAQGSNKIYIWSRSAY